MAQLVRHQKGFTMIETSDHERPTLVLGAALVAMAFVAALCFTFAVAVMPDLAGVDDHTFVLIMQRFDDNPVLPLTFTVGPALTVLAAVLHRRRGRSVAARWTIAAAVLCGIVVAITAAIHIPLNTDIDRVDLARIADLAEARNDFEARWVAWNIVRTLVAVAAVGALGCALGKRPVSTCAAAAAP